MKHLAGMGASPPRGANEGNTNNQSYLASSSDNSDANEGMASPKSRVLIQDPKHIVSPTFGKSSSGSRWSQILQKQNCQNIMEHWI